jgi:hypothetical protein
MINTGDFPQQIRLNKNTTVWSENDIIAWMNQQNLQAQPNTDIALKNSNPSQIDQGKK